MLSTSEKVLGRVVSLHLHSAESDGQMVNVWSMELVAGKGIAGNKRYFGRPTRRQVTLIEREQIAEHAAILGWESIAPGVVRSNIETEGADFSKVAGASCPRTGAVRLSQCEQDARATLGHA